MEKFIIQGGVALNGEVMILWGEEFGIAYHRFYFSCRWDSIVA